jgi:hypothetical protein
MMRAKFQDLLDRYGADLTQWPVADRLAAQSLLSSDPRAANALAEARYLDRLVQHSFAGAPSQDRAEEAVSRILSNLGKLPEQAPRARTEPARVQAGVAHQMRWPRIAALAFAAVLGIVIGYCGADRQAMQDLQRLSLAADESETELNLVLFDSDSMTGVSR